ncbi:putative metallo-beta-lactamase domain protein [Aspergillus homomorphus CBS 101889]|uniref:Putative metallo-beta-lactamase domain protein n=1 Tax=Aspergillus homomorphus (strain CBS 101889) TaxID=1450537 RepID=A0A395HK21_ASPHC|nr:putative metallo-beta-lactamase domain protein [Aspergillus homomorphus CBS 101889]RAL08120.1 putative metallo-beta-lactamase domain protein [Aspergillus homomorphus CBS 101889]
MTTSKESPSLSSSSSLDFIICSTCGTQFPSPTPPPNCKICDDPRQFIPPTGQGWTTLRTLRNNNNNNSNAPPKYHNEFHPMAPTHPNLIAIHTVPKLAIGHRAFLCRTPHGNILWDCIPFLDEATIEKIHALGGLRAIVISHPHYYASHLEWAATFRCRVFLAAEDEEWVVRREEGQVFWEGKGLGISDLVGDEGAALADGPSGIEDGEDELQVIKTGGHFPGSAVLWWRAQRTLLIADTIGTVPSGIYHVDRVPGTASFTFMWSYPNMIPLPPDEVLQIWKAIKHADFDSTYGAFVGMHTHGESKKRILESAQIFVRAMGYVDHAIHLEDCP